MSIHQISKDGYRKIEVVVSRRRTRSAKGELGQLATHAYYKFYQVQNSESAVGKNDDRRTAKAELAVQFLAQLENAACF
jgi:hypothetical protein